MDTGQRSGNQDGRKETPQMDTDEHRFYRSKRRKRRGTSRAEKPSNQALPQRREERRETQGWQERRRTLTAEDAKYAEVWVGTDCCVCTKNLRKPRKFSGIIVRMNTDFTQVFMNFVLQQA